MKSPWFPGFLAYKKNFFLERIIFCLICILSFWFNLLRRHARTYTHTHACAGARRHTCRHVCAHACRQARMRTCMQAGTKKKISLGEILFCAVQLVAVDSAVYIPLGSGLQDVALATLGNQVAFLVVEFPNFPIFHFLVLLCFCFVFCPSAIIRYHIRKALSILFFRFFKKIFLRL